MYPWYYPYPWYDPFTLMYLMTQWMILPYYYALMFETYRTMIDAWRKALESLTRTVSASTTP
ncbi:MAG: hypothetical protein DRJ41_05120 [Thermoprotei archaeon]|nr:MAG: hypothetical protein DRJ41_05120 [Thermoprotei archaeon]